MIVFSNIIESMQQILRIHVLWFSLQLSGFWKDCDLSGPGGGHKSCSICWSWLHHSWRQALTNLYPRMSVYCCVSSAWHTFLSWSPSYFVLDVVELLVAHESISWYSCLWFLYEFLKTELNSNLWSCWLSYCCIGFGHLDIHSWLQVTR
jgi:hypothetical protein